MHTISVDDKEWLSTSLESLRCFGCAIISGVLTTDFCNEIKFRMYQVQQKIISDIGSSRLEKAGELGVLRLMMLYDPIFFKFLEIPPLLSIIDNTVSPTAIMHLQNGFILPPTPEKKISVFQNTFHMDFPRVLNGYLASINVFFALDEFTKDNGSTQVILGTHQKIDKPSEKLINDFSTTITCPMGSMIVFDSTLWHAAGVNITNKDRLAINHQFTPSYIKQQIDYCRALDNSTVQNLPPRTQQLLGYYTRVVTSLDEYYQPEENRLYRRGQG